MQRSDAQTYRPPQGVQEEAKRALAWIEQGRAGDGFTQTGRTRAGQLARGEAVSLDTVARIAAYLKRHTSDTRATGFDPGEEGYPTPGRVAWAAWGGDAALRWASAILDEIEAKQARDDERASRGDGHLTAKTHAAPIPVRLDAEGSALSAEDRALLRPPQQLPDGAWRLDALAARGGEVKVYPWGEEQTAWGELSSPAVLAAFEGLPVTMEHPASQTVTPDSAQTAPLIPGARVLGVTPRADAQALVLTLAVPSIPDVRGVSVGWGVGRIDNTTSPPTQRDLTPNHLALTPRPRAKAEMRLDAQPQGAVMKINLGGKEYEVPDDMGAALQAELDKMRSDKAALQAEIDALKGKADAAMAERMDSERADKVRAEARELAALYRDAAPHLADADRARVDSLGSDEIRRLALAKLRPTLDVAGKSAEYVRAAYDVAIDTHRSAEDSAKTQAARLDGRNPAPPARTPGRALDAHWLNPSRKEAN